MAGMSGLSKSASDELKNSLASQSAPANPQTPPNPADRKDPSELGFIDIQRIRKSADVAAQNVDESDPKALLYSGISATMTRILTAVDLSEAVDVLLERLFPLSSPELKARMAAMFTPISPPAGPAGGAQAPGPSPMPNLGAAGGATGQSPGGAPAPTPGEAGPPA